MIIGLLVLNGKFFIEICILFKEDIFFFYFMLKCDDIYLNYFFY